MVEQKDQLQRQYNDAKRQVQKYGIIKQNVDGILRTTPEKEQMQGVEAEELPLTVSQFAKVYEDVREWAKTPGNMEDAVNPGLAISFMNARYSYSGELDFGELTYVYSLSTRKITPLEGEYTGEKAYGTISGGYPMAFIFIDK